MVDQKTQSTGKSSQGDQLLERRKKKLTAYMSQLDKALDKLK